MYVPGDPHFLWVRLPDYFISLLLCSQTPAEQVPGQAQT